MTVAAPNTRGHDRHHDKSCGGMNVGVDCPERRGDERHPRPEVGDHGHLGDDQNAHRDADAGQQAPPRRRSPSGRHRDQRGQHAEREQPREPAGGGGIGRSETDGEAPDEQQQHLEQRRGDGPYQVDEQLRRGDRAPAHRQAEQPRNGAVGEFPPVQPADADAEGENTRGRGDLDGHGQQRGPITGSGLRADLRDDLGVSGAGRGNHGRGQHGHPDGEQQTGPDEHPGRARLAELHSDGVAQRVPG